MRIKYLHQSQLDALIALTETCSHFMALFNQNAEQDKLAYTLKRMGDDLVRCANEGISTVEYKTRREKEAKDSEPASDGVLPEQG